MSCAVNSILHRVGLVARTASHLRPSQVAHRARLRTQKAALERWGEPIGWRLARPRPPAWGWPVSFQAPDAVAAAGSPSPEANAAGTFELLARTRHLGDPAAWDAADADQLWRYHLHYWEWAWAFAAHPDRLWARAAFARLWRSWKAATTVGRWDAWSPYVVSLRAWVMCGVHDSLVGGSEGETGFVDDIALHAGFAAANLERDVGGNHLIKNLKALMGTGVFLGDHRLVARASGCLARQIAVQVRGDGGHFELSPSYHCQVLGDLLDVGRLLAAAGAAPVPGLDEAVAAMRAWLGTMMLPDGHVPLLNDCIPLDARRLGALAPTTPPPQPLIMLEPSGYAVVRLGPWHLVADVGRPCPPGLPAHAHADTLSFVLCADGRPVVDTGTSEYGAGPRRRYERSTAAHNTVEVDGIDSTEVWGAFRAGRRARAVVERARSSPAEVVLTAGHDGYRHLRGRPVHRRTWRVTPEEVTITDEVLGTGHHTIVARLHTTVADDAESGGRVTAEVAGAVVGFAGPRDPDLGKVAAGFGVIMAAGCLQATASGSLPLRLSTTLRSGRAAAPGAYHLGVPGESS